MNLDDVPGPSGACIVGVGATPQGELPGMSSEEIAASAFRDALDDAGLEKAEVNGLITCKSVHGHGVDTEVGSLLGLDPSYSATLDYGTCNFSIHLAAMVLDAGLADTIALTYGTNVRSAGFRFGKRGVADVTAPYGFHHIAGPAALALRRHQFLYGTTEEDFAHIALVQREYAHHNPLAIFRDELTLDDYLAAPYLVHPLRRHDLTMVSDGGVAIIMTRPERAVALAQPAVSLVGMSQVTSLGELRNEDNLMRPWLGDLASRLFERARMRADDIDLVYLQDPTAVWVLQMLEWFGFAPLGEGAQYVADGNTRPDGPTPMNTNGGQLSESYMWGWLHVVELVRQLRGELAPDRQIAGASVALYASTMAFQKGAASIFALQP